MISKRFKIIMFGILIATVTPAAVKAQQLLPSQYEADYASAHAAVFSTTHIDQLLAPIALYPDPLIMAVLEASTTPLDIIRAYRWHLEGGNRELSGNALANALQHQNWNPAVKELVSSPVVLRALNDNIEWAEQLGRAYLIQQDDVYDSLQRLRSRAMEAGTLISTPQQTVVVRDRYIYIEPASAYTLHVPYYDPTVVYGVWPHYSYPPYYFVGYVPLQRHIVFSSGHTVVHFFHNRNRKLSQAHAKAHRRPVTTRTTGHTQLTRAKPEITANEQHLESRTNFPPPRASSERPASAHLFRREDSANTTRRSTQRDDAHIRQNGHIRGRDTHESMPRNNQMNSFRQTETHSTPLPQTNAAMVRNLTSGRERVQVIERFHNAARIAQSETVSRQRRTATQNAISSGQTRTQTERTARTIQNMRVHANPPAASHTESHRRVIQRSAGNRPQESALSNRRAHESRSSLHRRGNDNVERTQHNRSQRR